MALLSTRDKLTNYFTTVGIEPATLIWFATCLVKQFVSFLDANADDTVRVKHQQEKSNTWSSSRHAQAQDIIVDDYVVSYLYGTAGPLRPPWLTNELQPNCSLAG